MSSSRLTLLAACAVLVCAVALTEGLRMASGPKKCCFQFEERPLPLKRVVGYKMTNPQCTKRAILFKTVTGRQVCARPTDSWVQSHMTYLDEKLSQSRAPL
ncbi:chemokine (C-C motif) ligand 35, duplicate 1 [Megalops cyprinoides]|uniref:chemokine (C-C motif) ligand 35, duplicate 1 n=1 Tax=Megalops cyprinoides TaxID=118141 RepID=UPI001864B25A|nr:chemokine (C-C motif) ligand 35, duplicate 1 [Megalops cyprinoides]